MSEPRRENRGQTLPRMIASLLAASLTVGAIMGNSRTASAIAVPELPTLRPPSCVLAQLAGGGFSDVAGNVHEQAISCITAGGIAQGGPVGMPADHYGPGLGVQRDQMASFIVRMIDRAAPGALPAAPSGNFFGCDLGRRNVHFDAIGRLAAAGVVVGGPNGSAADCYGPAQVVRRDQMASFLNRAIQLVTGSPLASESEFFTDDRASVHRANINALAASGIVAGTAPRSFDPLASVRRDQMASFVARTVDLLLGPDPTTPRDGILAPGVVPAHWTDVGVLGYFDPVLNRKLTYADLKTDLQPLIDSGVLSRSGDSYEVVKEGAQIVGYDFPPGTNLRIKAANVTLKRNRIRAGHSTNHPGALYFQNLAPGTAVDGSQSTVVIEDNEIVGGKFGIYPSFQGVRLLARRNAVIANTINPDTGRASTADLDMADGIDWRGTFKQIDNEAMASVLEQNWVGGFVNGGTGHHYDGIVTVSGGNLKVLHNRVEAYGVTQTVGVRVVSDIAPIRNVWVEGNSVAGFGYSFGLGWGNPTHAETGELTNITFRHNVSEAGTYQWGPLTVHSKDEDTGQDAMVNFVREDNSCVPGGSTEDMSDRWRSLPTIEVVQRCNEKI